MVLFQQQSQTVWEFDLLDRLVHDPFARFSSLKDRAGRQQRIQRAVFTENRTLYALLPTGTILQRAESREGIVDKAIQKIELPNGLRLLLKEDHRLPFVEFRVVFQGGVLSENQENNGLTL